MNVVKSMQFGFGIIHIILQQQIYVEIENIVGASIVPVVWVFHSSRYVTVILGPDERESPVFTCVLYSSRFVSELHACMHVEVIQLFNS